MNTTIAPSELAAAHADLARTVYDAFNRGDFERATTLAHADIEVDFAAWDRTLHGREGFSQFLRGWKVIAPDGIIEVRSQLAGDDGVTNECVFHGTHTGPFLTPNGEVAATGRPFAVRFRGVVRVRDGLLASITNYADMDSLLAQLGLMPLAK